TWPARAACSYVNGKTRPPTPPNRRSQPMDDEITVPISDADIELMEEARAHLRKARDDSIRHMIAIKGDLERFSPLERALETIRDIIDEAQEHHQLGENSIADMVTLMSEFPKDVSNVNLAIIEEFASADARGTGGTIAQAEKARHQLQGSIVVAKHKM